MSIKNATVPFSGECDKCETGYTWKFPAEEVNGGLQSELWISPPCGCKRAILLARDHNPEGKHE